MVSESKPWQVRDKYAVQTELKRWGLIKIKGIGEEKWKREREEERGGIPMGTEGKKKREK